VSWSRNRDETKEIAVAKRSAGLLVYRPVDAGIEVLAVHPGGPFWAKKDKGAWSIPKGELEPSEQPTELEDGGHFPEGIYSAARREYEEEIGLPAPEGDPIDLGEIRQAGGKVVRAFALRFGGPDEPGTTEPLAVLAINSNLVELEWPRGTGRILTFPEVDKAQWMTPDVAREKLIPSQVVFVDRLLERLGA
jgi:predicted NUDIX family NTP pyrophosphohydrolase